MFEQFCFVIRIILEKDLTIKCKNIFVHPHTIAETKCFPLTLNFFTVIISTYVYILHYAALMQSVELLLPFCRTSTVLRALVRRQPGTETVTGPSAENPLKYQV